MTNKNDFRKKIVENIMTTLYDLKTFFKFGDFTLSSGTKSDYYIDLREIQSKPNVIHDVCVAMRYIIQRGHAPDFICGVPTAGVPYATLVSHMMNIPMISLRKEVKSYGTGKMIEGDTSLVSNLSHACVVLIDDVSTTGGSIANARDKLYEYGFGNNIISIVVYDRGCGHDIIPNMISLYNHTHLDRVRDLRKYLTYVKNMKNSRLIYSMDKYNNESQLRELAPYICGVKLHSDMISYAHNDIIRMSYEFHFIIIEDRKLADISKTNHSIIDTMYWADAVTIHGISGLSEMTSSSKMLIPIAQMSSSDNMLNSEYTSHVMSFAYSNPKCVLGVVAQNKWDDVLTFTPGIHVSHVRDGNQTYRHPKEVDSDFIIVGSGLHNFDDETLKEYLM